MIMTMTGDIWLVYRYYLLVLARLWNPAILCISVWLLMQ